MARRRRRRKPKKKRVSKPATRSGRAATPPVPPPPVSPNASAKTGALARKKVKLPAGAKNKSIKTAYGEFDISPFAAYEQRGGEIVFAAKFNPGPLVDARSFAFVQSKRSVKPKQEYPEIDQSRKQSANPVFGTHTALGYGARKISDIPGGITSSGSMRQSYTSGYRYRDGKKWKVLPAAMQKHIWGANLYQSGGETFETTVLGLSGKQKRAFYGSVKWGWRRIGNRIELDAPRLAGRYIPTKSFFQAAARWNRSTSDANSVLKNAATPLIQVGGKTIKVPRAGTRLVRDKGFQKVNGKLYYSAYVVITNPYTFAKLNPQLSKAVRKEHQNCGACRLIRNGRILVSDLKNNGQHLLRFQLPTAGTYSLTQPSKAYVYRRKMFIKTGVIFRTGRFYVKQFAKVKGKKYALVFMLDGASAGSVFWLPASNLTKNLNFLTF